MMDDLSMDQKIEVLKLAHLEATMGTGEAYRKFVSLLTEDRCQKCRDSLKNVISELEGIRVNHMNPGVVKGRVESENLGAAILTPG